MHQATNSDSPTNPRLAVHVFAEPRPIAGISTTGAEESLAESSNRRSSESR